MIQKIFLILMVALAGCSTTPVYKEIQQTNGKDNTRVFTATSAQLQKALSKTLLSKQFTINSQDDLSGTMTASRSFSKEADIMVVGLQAKIFSNSESEQQLFLNGTQTTQHNYIADRTRFLLWIIPLPGGGGKEVTKTKAFEAAITDKSFYDDLFAAVQMNLPIRQAGLPAPPYSVAGPAPTESSGPAPAAASSPLKSGVGKVTSVDKASFRGSILKLGGVRGGGAK